MITVKEAKQLILEHTIHLPPVKVPLNRAWGHLLASKVYAHCDIPSFRQSSMDGYAIRFADHQQVLKLAGEMAAGTSKPLTIQPGEACRIFTGAPLPDGADSVVMQEKVQVEDGQVNVQDPALQLGANVRAQGAEIENGALAMTAGSYLSPAAVGFLAGIGTPEVEVYPMPSVSIIVTGKELQQPGLPLGFGQVYESNSYSLSAALRHEGIHDIRIHEADDNLDILTDVLQTALLESSVVLLTGGVSVGDYDFVLEASRACGVTQVFHKVKQRPGKPLFFGTRSRKLVFGLPGNPSSVLSCYYNYVLPALKRLSHLPERTKEITAVLTSSYQKAAGLTHFLKGSYHDGHATPLSAQESFRLSSFAEANCLICLEENQETFNAGDTVTILLLAI